ncbi:hypothetical protein [Ferribacterium limneticum]|uniref:hypothetical protein n=1 Tax=Ferribacterium limneticum TaxID=76259 RepID=UPI001CFBB859|nr:hypothetical protein [Ferribacterium limneticum]UCV17226.1 hypothetical protein KI610_10225 [Ferribacterium limneticum]
MDTKYTPNAGEQQLLGDFNSRMSDINRVAQNTGLAILPDHMQEKPINAASLATMSEDERNNAEKTKRWALEDLQEKATGPRSRRAMAPAINAATSEYSKLFGFAEGGKPETADELMARINAKYGVAGNTQAAPAPAAVAPAPQPQAQPERQPGGMLLRAAGLLGSRKQQIEKAINGYAGGGELNDDQLAERSVNAVDRRRLIQHRQKQNAEIEQAVKVKAHARGGKIKGPGTPTSDSIPAKVPETGEDILVSTEERILSKEQDDLLLRIAKAMGFETVDQLLESGTGKPVGPTLRQGKAAAATGMAPTEETLHNGPYTGDGASLVKDFKGWQSNKIAETNAKIDLATGKTPQASYSNEGRSVPAPVTAPEQHPVTVPASRASTAPAPAARVPGAKLFSNLPDGVVAVDSSAAALIDQKNSTYNPARQLENMQRLRLTSDATDPTITDPNVRAQAVQGLVILNAGRAGADTSALAQENINQARTGSEMRSKLLDPNTPPEERSRMIQTLQAINGKADRPTNLQVHDLEVPLDEKQPLLGMRKQPHSFNPMTGEFKPLQSQQQASDPMSQAKAAIARGADRAAVNARLKAMGFPEVK